MLFSGPEQASGVGPLKTIDGLANRKIAAHPAASGGTLSTCERADLGTGIQASGLVWRTRTCRQSIVA